jgi:hypothetical protein
VYTSIGKPQHKTVYAMAGLDGFVPEEGHRAAQEYIADDSPGPVRDDNSKKKEAALLEAPHGKDSQIMYQNRDLDGDKCEGVYPEIHPKCL